MPLPPRRTLLLTTVLTAAAIIGCSRKEAASPATAAATAPADDTATLNRTTALKGKPAPPLDVQTVDGKPFKLADQAGKVVVLDFWATWCVPCVRALPHLQEMAERRAFVDGGLVVLAVNLQEEPDRVKKFLAEKKLTFPVTIDDGKIAESYLIDPIPVTVVIGRDGKVVEAVLGGEPKDLDTIGQAVSKALAAK